MIKNRRKASTSSLCLSSMSLRWNKPQTAIFREILLKRKRRAVSGRKYLAAKIKKRKKPRKRIKMRKKLKKNLKKQVYRRK